MTTKKKKKKEGSVDKWLLSSSTWILTGAMWWGGGGTKGFQGLRGRRKLSLKSRRSRVRPSYNPWARLNHYPPPSQESNERTMDGSELSARKGNQTKWRRRERRK